MAAAVGLRYLIKGTKNQNIKSENSRFPFNIFLVQTKTPIKDRMIMGGGVDINKYQ